MMRMEAVISTTAALGANRKKGTFTTNRPMLVAIA
jgi:hypothetical protein